MPGNPYAMCNQSPGDYSPTVIDAVYYEKLKMRLWKTSNAISFPIWMEKRQPEAFFTQKLTSGGT